MKYVARLFDPDGQRLLTKSDHQALEFGKYTWTIDGFDGPVCRRGNTVAALLSAEFEALARLVREPGAEMTLTKLFGENSSARRFEKARAKVEFGAPRGGGSFRTSGNKDAKRFVFRPNPNLTYCLIEPITPRDKEPSIVGRDQALNWPRSADQFGDWSVIRNITLPAIAESVAPRAAADLGLKPRTGPSVSVEGIRVQIHSFRSGKKEVRARVTVVNGESEPRIIVGFALSVGGRSWKARRARETARIPRRTAARRVAAIDPVMLLLPAQGKVTGSLFFPRPNVAGEAEIRPHVLRATVVG